MKTETVNLLTSVIVGIVVVAVAYAPVACTEVGSKAMVELTRLGATPAEARCAVTLYGSSGCAPVAPVEVKP